MMKKCIFIFALSVAIFTVNSAFADDNTKKLELKARIGYNIGATTPIGIPATIRSIEAFRLTPSFMAGADVMMPLCSKWGIATGLRFENKAMNADAMTKGYRTELVKGDSKVEGLFTGLVKQKVTEWMFTVPVKATYQVSPKVTLSAGPYISLLISKDFSGIASDGYLRQGDPTGPKIIIGNKEGEWATYDFSDEMRNFQVGIAAGVDWQLYQNFGLSADVNWGLSGIFKSDFKTVEQSLYPVYGTIGVFYKF